MYLILIIKIFFPSQMMNKIHGSNTIFNEIKVKPKELYIFKYQIKYLVIIYLPYVLEGF